MPKSPLVGQELTWKPPFLLTARFCFAIGPGSGLLSSSVLAVVFEFAAVPRFLIFKVLRCAAPRVRVGRALLFSSACSIAARRASSSTLLILRFFPLGFVSVASSAENTGLSAMACSLSAAGHIQSISHLILGLLSTRKGSTCLSKHFVKPSIDEFSNEVLKDGLAEVINSQI